jgi:hypothetical protein
MLIRCIIVAFFAINGAFLPPDRDTPPRALLVAIAAVSLLFWTFSGVSMLTMMRKRQPNKNWAVPSWGTQPFSGPAHFMHTAAWSFAAMGTVALLSDGMRQGILFENPIAMMVLPAGVGLLIGLRLYYGTV